MVTPVLIIGLLVLVAAAVKYGHGKITRREVQRRFDLLSNRASRRLQFRHPVLADRDFYLEMATDPVAAEANGWSGAEVEAVRTRFRDRHEFARYQGSEIVAFERSTSVRVGTATFSQSPLDPENARSIGLHVHPDHRRQGYGRDIMAAAIALLQYEPGPVHVGTRTDNVAMQQVMAQLGYGPEPGSQPYVAPNGQTYDGYWYHCGADTQPPAGLHHE